MSHVLVQHIMQDISGLAEDRYINTWHFDTAAPTEADYLALGVAVNNFYERDTSGVSGNLLKWFANHALAPGSGAKVYDMADPMPRKPRVFVPAASTGVPVTETYPAEVAVCLSFACAPVAGIPVASLRGRVYLGPLNISAGENVPAGAWARPILAMRNQIIVSAAMMRTEANSLAASEWSVWSPKKARLFPVNRAWVDDAWDTQRRRGAPPASRVTTPIP